MGYISSEVGYVGRESTGLFISRTEFMEENKDKTPKRSKGGRKPGHDTAIYRYSVNFNAEQHARFLTLWEQSGVQSKAQFIAARVLGSEFRVVKIDRATMEYVGKLTALFAQFRAVGVNYNQVVHALNSNLSEKKALAFLFKLEQLTKELVEVSRRIVVLTEELKNR